MAADATAEQLAAATLAGDGAAQPGATAEQAAAEQVVTPWDVQSGAGGIDYDKLLSTFGCLPIDEALIARCAADGCRVAGAPSSRVG